MPSYCLKCVENTKNIILQVSRAINYGIIILLKCVICGCRKSKFNKEQEAKGLLNNLLIRKLFSKILILRDILFGWNVTPLYKMNV